MHGQRLSADISALSMALGEAEQRGLQEIYRMAKHGEHMRKSCSNHGEFHGFVVGKTMP